MAQNQIYAKVKEKLSFPSYKNRWLNKGVN